MSTRRRFCSKETRGNACFAKSRNAAHQGRAKRQDLDSSLRHMHTLIQTNADISSQPDFSTDSCGICHRQFTYFFRRHHCRRCGDVVCGAHLSHTVPLDHNARLHYHARQYRACDTCFTDYKDWMRLRHSRANSIAESQASSQGTAVPSNPGLTIPVHGRSGEANDLRVGSMARSMGMEWSTF